MRCELADTVSGNHRLRYAMTTLLACARGAGSYFCRVRFVLLSRVRGLSRGLGSRRDVPSHRRLAMWWAVAAWRGDLAIFER